MLTGKQSKLIRQSEKILLHVKRNRLISIHELHLITFISPLTFITPLGYTPYNGLQSVNENADVKYYS